MHVAYIRFQRIIMLYVCNLPSELQLIGELVLSINHLEFLNLQFYLHKNHDYYIQIAQIETKCVE